MGWGGVVHTWVGQDLPVQVEGVALGEGDDLHGEVGGGEDEEDGAEGGVFPVQVLDELPGDVEQDQFLKPQATCGDINIK